MSQSRRNSSSPYSPSHYSSTNFNESPAKLNTPSKKPQWNDYLTDPNQFKISKSELIRRKKSFVSKHNILANDNVPKVSSINSSFSPRKNKSVSSPIKRATHVNSTPSPNTTTRVPYSYSIKSKQKSSKNVEELNSIDLLYNQDESNLHKTLDLYEFDSNGEEDEEENDDASEEEEDSSIDDNEEDMESTFTVDLKNKSTENVDKTTLYGMNLSKISNIKNNEKRMMRININKSSNNNNNNNNNNTVRVKKSSKSIDRFDLEDMMTQVKGLGTELRYYVST
jgi:hypothetical protein